MVLHHPSGQALVGGMQADRIVTSRIADEAVRRGLCHADELAQLSAGWRAWAASEDGWFRCCTASCLPGGGVSRPRVAGLAELLAEHGDATYREVLRVPALSLGLFAAAPGHDDVQSPHAVDEVYVVVAGRAVLEVDGVRAPVQAGSVAHVPPHVPHRFVEVTEDLRVVVVFAPAGSG